MMNGRGQQRNIDFTVDRKNLYREESITDLKVASIRRLTPVTPDGKDDASRKALFIGQTQLMSPEGPLPLQAMIEADNFEDAMDAFPKAMELALNDMVKQIEKMHQQEQMQNKSNSRIIIPGR